MAKFKIGDRVKIVGPSIGGCSSGIGKIANVERITGCGWCDLDGDPTGRGGTFLESSLEAAPRFKIGDEVRVKAGSPQYEMPGCEAWIPRISHFGKKLTILSIDDEGRNRIDNNQASGCGGHRVDSQHLEPWRDNERWLEGKWVPVVSWTATPEANTAKPAIVVKANSSWICGKRDSTNEAFRLAEEQAAKDPGVEYVVYQEKGSRKVEKKSKAEELVDSIMKHGSVAHNADGRWMNDTCLSAEASGDIVTIKFRVAGD